ncbi:HD-GYP domain-containing protein [Chitinimonas sp.]|uniref:HD-GYP domain-containing protein n=1 Tax=Chitinimonas sp. TaxID=1934313 RepID=UPI0035AEAE27
MLKKIPVSSLRVGMYIHEICGSWDEHPFLLSSFAVRSERDVRRMQQSSVTEVWINLRKGCDVLPDPAVNAAAHPTAEVVQAQVERTLDQARANYQSPVRVSLVQEMVQAARVCAKGKSLVVSMFKEARMGRAVNPEGAVELVDEISASVMRNPGAFVSLARLKTADDYTYMHSVAVCALMIALGRQLGMGPEELREVGLAGLLHDFGKAYIPEAILNKAGKLTDEEFEIMKEHPRYGHQALLEGQQVGPIVLDVCLHHHEKTNGSGYPQRLADEQISLYAKMAAVCDVYDAITSNRPYKQGWDPGESIRKMAEWADGHFDQRVFHAFVKSLGIYPIGSLVQMNTGMLAVVVEQSEKSLLAPLVRVIYSTELRQLAPSQLVNLAAPGCTDKIVSSEDPGKWGLDKLERFALQPGEIIP